MHGWSTAVTVNYLVCKNHWNKGASRQRLPLASFFVRHKEAANHSTPHLHHHCPREFVLEFQMMFAVTRLRIGLWNVTSVAAAKSAKAIQPPPSVRNVMCVFASLRKEIASNLTIWPRLNCQSCCKDWEKWFRHGANNTKVLFSLVFLHYVCFLKYWSLLFSFIQLHCINTTFM